jgi:hypothetical protein
VIRGARAGPAGPTGNNNNQRPGKKGIVGIKEIIFKNFATMFLRYLRGNRRYLIFLLISVIDFYYVINKLIILVSISH